MKCADLIEKYKSCDSLGLIGCGDGWAEIIDRCLAKIDPECRAIMQIKEKFGGLRIYPYIYSQEIEVAIMDAEREAAITCELCGSRVDVSTTARRGWIKTLCKSCGGM